MDYNEHVLQFIQETRWDYLPAKVQHQAKRCLLDTLGGLIAGRNTPVGDLVESLVLEQFPGEQATIVVSGAKSSASGAALANGFACNALDIDDGYRDIKGHPGASILPVLLAAAQLAPATDSNVKLSGTKKPVITGKEFLEALVIGYEIAICAGLIRHATYDVYHSTGSYSCIGGAAAAGKLIGLSPKQLWHCLGAAEYHAPIAPMMKGIETPSMGKDSIGWSCMVAVMSILMAKGGFTGVKPIFDDCPEEDWITSLGDSWKILNLYFKPYSGCRWAQPGVDGAVKIIADHRVEIAEIQKINVYTFKESSALSSAYPKNTEEAQYNIAYPLAAVLLDGEVGPKQVLPPRIFDKDIRELMDKISIFAEDRLQKNFPEKAESEVEIILSSGQIYRSGVMSARWDMHSTLPTDEELSDKFMWLTAPIIGDKNALALNRMVMLFDGEENIDDLFRLIVKSGSGRKI